MMLHDGDDELRRWFHNYSQKRDEITVGQHEWLVIEEETRVCRGKTIVTYVGTIGADHHDRRRVVRFEPGAPPPPTFLQPVRKKWEPPVEPTGHERRMQERQRAYEIQMMASLWRAITPQQWFVAQTLPPVTPKQTWRRNA